MEDFAAAVEGDNVAFEAVLLTDTAEFVVAAEEVAMTGELDE